MYYVATIYTNPIFQPTITENFENYADAKEYVDLMNRTKIRGKNYSFKVLTDDIPEPIGEEIEDVPESTL